MQIIGSKSLILALGSILTAGINFYSLVILPAYGEIHSLGSFVRHNYLGGLYLYGVVSSVGVLGVYILSVGKFVALYRYILASLAIIFLICTAGAGMAEIPWSYICLVATIFLHIIGLLQIVLIRQGKAVLACISLMLQPMAFALFATIQYFGWINRFEWSLFYLISCLISFLFYFACADWSWIRKSIAGKPVEFANWGSIISRMLLSISFPLFFQLELILFGHFGTSDVGEYAIIQKMYSSISISIFSSVGILIVGEGVSKGGYYFLLLNKKIFFVGFVSALCVLPLGLIISSVGKGMEIDFKTIFVSSLLAFMLSVCSFVNLGLSIRRPFLALGLLIGSFIFYLISFFISSPEVPFAYLLNAGGGLGFYLLSFLCWERLKIFNVKDDGGS